jgi:hypothetical protein
VKLRYGYGIAVLTLVIMAAPAQARKHYYIVRNTITNECTIVSRLPQLTKGTSTVVVQNATVYKSKTDAKSALKAVQVCTNM